MPVLRVNSGGCEHEIPFTPGASLRDIMMAGCIHLGSGCGGVGSCGLCLVRIDSGTVNECSVQELLRIRPDELRAGVRFACQVKPVDDLRVTILHNIPSSSWRPLIADGADPFQPSRIIRTPAKDIAPFAVAVDLGTTHIRLAIRDMVNGTRVSGRIGLNPQLCYGGDVMTRLAAASASPVRAREIALKARDAIGGAISDMAIKEGVCPERIGRVVIVGNSAMLALLSGRNVGLLLDPSSWTSTLDCRPMDSATWVESWGIAPSAQVELVQPLAGFVGSDLLAGVLATRLTDGVGGSLLIDFGTNSEIALWDGRGLLVTSAAGGPAFEGCGISCGMPAEPGAIYRIRAEEDSPGFSYDTIGGGEAVGICGSGLVDLIASLRRRGELTGGGRFARESGKDGAVIVPGEAGLRLTQRDIDAFQRAKAAIGAGTNCLISMAGMGPKDLRRVVVCGAFGNYLNIENAMEIGLLPPVTADVFEICANSALSGCESLLFSGDGGDPLSGTRRAAQTVNLAQARGFEELFIEGLYLRPQRFS